MARAARQLVDHGYYHIISRGNNAMPLFNIENGFAMFKFILFESKKKFTWKLHLSTIYLKKSLSVAA